MMTENTIMKDVTKVIFQIEPVLSAISMAHRNSAFIADAIFPRKPVRKNDFKYRSYSLQLDNPQKKRTGNTDGRIGFSMKSGSVINNSLDSTVPITHTDANIYENDDVTAEVEFLTDQNELKREKRVAGMVFNKKNYTPGNFMTLSGEDQFSSRISNPVKTIESALNSCFFRPNRAAMGNRVWNTLSKHQAIQTECGFTFNTDDHKKRKLFAEQFELDEIFIGCNYYNTAKPGQLHKLTQVWENSLLLYHYCPIADTMNGFTFGITAQLGTRFAGYSIQDDGCLVRQGESVREVIIARDLGFLIDSVVN